MGVVSIELSAVVFHDPDAGRWIAHCLQMDVVGEGDTPAAAFTQVQQLCDLQIEACLEEGDLEGIFRPAPPKAWAMYSKARPAKGMEATRPTAHIERFGVREYTTAA